MRLSKLRLSIKERFGHMGIIRKLVVAYIVLILVPILFMLVYTSQLNRRNIINQDINEHRKATYNLTSDTINQIEYVNDISNRLSYNEQIVDFLGDDFVIEQNVMIHYTDVIIPIISNLKSINRYSVEGVSIYTNNVSIPESWNHLFHDYRISGKEWFRNFYNSDKREMWITSSQLKNYGFQVNDETAKYYAYIKKIYDTDGTYLGVVSVRFTEDSMMKGLNAWLEEDDYLCLVDGQERSLIYANHFDEGFNLDKYIEIMGNGKGYEYSDDSIIAYEELGPLGLTLFYKTHIDDNNTTLLNQMMFIAVIAILGSVLLITIIYIVIRKTLGDMNIIAKSMIIAARGDLSARVETKRMDEVGQIGESYNILLNRINDLIAEVVEKEMAQKNAQLNALQYQINPHFIYNTLDIFRMKLEISGDIETGNVIATFGKLLRYNLKGSDKYSTLTEEINQVENYMEIQRFRLGDNLSWSCHIPEELKTDKIVKLILQPVVENSINHGYKGHGHPLTVQINIVQQEDRFEVHVKDNGKGINTEKLQYINHEFKVAKYDRMRDKIIDRGIGLTNVNLRIKLFYGNNCHIRMESVEGSGTTVIIPILREDLEDV